MMLKVDLAFKCTDPHVHMHLYSHMGMDKVHKITWKRHQMKKQASPLPLYSMFMCAEIAGTVATQGAHRWP